MDDLREVQPARPLDVAENRYNNPISQHRITLRGHHSEDRAIITIGQVLPRLGGCVHLSRAERLAVRDARPGLIRDERYIKRLLWHLLGGTRGGPNRAEIIMRLQDRPCNANQLAETLRVDYKTIQHHIRILEENGLVTTSDRGTYGAILLLTPRMEEAFPLFDEIWTRIGRRKISSTSGE